MTTNTGRMVARMCDAAGAVYDLSGPEIMARNHTRSAARARGAVYVVLYHDRQWPQRRIGDAFGRDESTICSAIQRTIRIAHVDQLMKQAIEETRSAVRQISDASS